MKTVANTYHDEGLGAARAAYVAPRFDAGPKSIWRAEAGSAARGSMEIPDWRKRIDELDEQIVQLLSERAAAAVAIGQLKSESSSPIYEPQRERAVFEHVQKVNPGPLSGPQVQDVYERIMDVMRALQRPGAAGEAKAPQ